MKALLLSALLFLATALVAQQQPPKPVDMRTLLLQELHETHNQKNWFVSFKEATAGLTPEQSDWTDGKGNHSVGQLAYHLVYWNSEVLSQLKGEAPKKFDGNNDATFTKYDSKQWDATLKQYDDILTQMEDIVSKADDTKLAKMAAVLTRVCNHNAYHIGEIVMVRKEQGSWNPETGVK